MESAISTGPLHFKLDRFEAIKSGAWGAQKPGSLFCGSRAALNVEMLIHDLV
jgi:hypothetical protein